ncbi:MAG: hypothetical protein R8F63_08590 [Acidimicrobiales bacterium]|nr:hypothetical protein [Acidimicrobiales bacterium]
MRALGAFGIAAVIFFALWMGIAAGAIALAESASPADGESRPWGFLILLVGLFGGLVPAWGISATAYEVLDDWFHSGSTGSTVAAAGSSLVGIAMIALVVVSIIMVAIFLTIAWAVVSGLVLVGVFGLIFGRG